MTGKKRYPLNAASPCTIGSSSWQTNQPKRQENYFWTVLTFLLSFLFFFTAHTIIVVKAGWSRQNLLYTFVLFGRVRIIAVMWQHIHLALVHYLNFSQHAESIHMNNNSPIESNLNLVYKYRIQIKVMKWSIYTTYLLIIDFFLNKWAWTRIFISVCLSFLIYKNRGSSNILFMSVIEKEHKTYQV